MWENSGKLKKTPQIFNIQHVIITSMNDLSLVFEGL